MPRLTQNTPSGRITRRALLIPDEYLPDVADALFELSYPFNWEQHGTATPQSVADLMLTMFNNFETMIIGDDVNGGYFELPVWSPDAQIGNWGFATLSGAWGGGHWQWSSRAIGDLVRWNVWLNAGNWQCKFMTDNTNSSGIVVAELDGISAGSFDLFANTATNNVVHAGSAWTVSTPGEHQFQLRVTGKNASSSNFQMNLNGCSLQRVP